MLGQIPLRLDHRPPDRLHRLGRRIAQSGCRDHPFGQDQVDVVTTQVRVSVGRQDLKHTLLNLENRYVERAAAEIVDRDGAPVSRIQSVGKGRGRWLIDDPQDFKTGNPACVARCGALRIIEVRRHGDHGPVHLEVELARITKVLFGPTLQVTQHERGDL